MVFIHLVQFLITRLQKRSSCSAVMGRGRMNMACLSGTQVVLLLLVPSFLQAVTITPLPFLGFNVRPGSRPGKATFLGYEEANRIRRGSSEVNSHNNQIGTGYTIQKSQPGFYGKPSQYDYGSYRPSNNGGNSQREYYPKYKPETSYWDDNGYHNRRGHECEPGRQPSFASHGFFNDRHTPNKYGGGGEGWFQGAGDERFSGTTEGGGYSSGPPPWGSGRPGGFPPGNGNSWNRGNNQGGPGGSSWNRPGGTPGSGNWYKPTGDPVGSSWDSPAGGVGGGKWNGPGGRPGGGNGPGSRPGAESWNRPGAGEGGGNWNKPGGGGGTWIDVDGGNWNRPSGGSEGSWSRPGGGENNWNGADGNWNRPIGGNGGSWNTPGDRRLNWNGSGWNRPGDGGNWNGPDGGGGPWVGPGASNSNWDRQNGGTDGGSWNYNWRGNGGEGWDGSNWNTGSNGPSDSSGTRDESVPEGTVGFYGRTKKGD